MSGAGDIDHDGYSEIVIGEPGMGRAPVFHGTPSGPAIIATPTLVGTDDFGTSVAAAGDVNGDGYADVIVGTPQQGVSGGMGHVDLFRGGPDCLDNIAIWSVDGTASGQHMGTAVAGIGDLDDDGFCDIAGSVSPTYGLMVDVYYGSPTWPSSQATATIYGSGGSGLAGANPNGDGFAELIIGHPGQSEVDSSRINLFAPSYYTGRPRLPRQVQPSGTAPIALLGRATSTSLRLRLRGYSPIGRARVRLQWQASASETGWGTLRQGSWVDTGPVQQGLGSVASFDELIDLVQTNTPFSWRVRVADNQVTYGGSPWFSIQGNGPHQSDLRTGTVLAGNPVGQPPSSRIIQALRPNPSSNGIAMRFNVQAGSRLDVTLMDVRGRRVRRIFSGAATAGTQDFDWDGRNDQGRRVAQGIYFLSVRAGGRSESEKVTVLR